jgi:hypothetical protein
MIFTTTDIDGDTLTVTTETDDFLTITVGGEDGHRSVYLTEDDVARLTEALAQITPIHRG